MNANDFIPDIYVKLELATYQGHDPEYILKAMMYGAVRNVAFFKTRTAVDEAIRAINEEGGYGPIIDLTVFNPLEDSRAL